MNTILYRNYTACVKYDSDDELFTGRIDGISDIVGFHGDSMGDLENAFKEAVDDYVEACAKMAKPPEPP